MYPHLADAFADRLHVTKIAKLSTPDTGSDPRAGMAVTQIGKPIFECLGLANFEHV